MEYVEQRNRCEITLDRMKMGDIAYVKQLHTAGNMRRRLLDMGLVEGTCVECVLKSPGNDPMAYVIRSAVIALRSEDSSQIVVELL